MITLLLAGVMAFSMGACGKTENTGADKKEVSTASETQEPQSANGDENTLTVWACNKMSRTF